MAEDTGKVYTPVVIADIPFPQETPVDLVASQQVAGGTYGQTAIKDSGFPVKRTAIELLSTTLNTRSRKILAEFEFTQTGALQIGKYESGISGDIRISPNGILGRDIAGNTTFALDGETGDAVFAGQLRAGSTIVSNSIVTEQASSGNGRTVYYNNGIPAIVIGDPS